MSVRCHVWNCVDYCFWDDEREMPCVKQCRLFHVVQFYKCNGQCHPLLPKSKQKQQYLQVQTLIFWENHSFIYILIMPKTFSRMLYHVTMIKQNAASVILSCCDLPWYHFHSSEKYTTWTVGKFTFLYKSLCQGTQIKKTHKWQLSTNMFQAEIWYTISFQYWGTQCSNAQYSSTVVVGCAVSFHSHCFMCVCDHIMLIVLTHTVCLCSVFSPRQVDSNIVNILRQRKLECMQWEGPDAKYKCKKVSDDYDEAATNWFIKCNFILPSSSIVIACLNFYCCWCCCCLWPILFPLFLAFWNGSCLTVRWL